MKYKGNTVSKVVTGKSAEKLAEAIKTGGYVSNDAARETIRQILDNRQKQSKFNATKDKV